MLGAGALESMEALGEPVEARARPGEVRGGGGVGLAGPQRDLTGAQQLTGADDVDRVGQSVVAVGDVGAPAEVNAPELAVTVAGRFDRDDVEHRGIVSAAPPSGLSYRRSSGDLGGVRNLLARPSARERGQPVDRLRGGERR